MLILFDATFKEQIISLFGEKLCGVVDNATISDAWTPNRLVLKPSKKRIELFYVNTNNNKRKIARSFRSLWQANVFRKRHVKYMSTMIFVDCSIQPVKPVEFITLTAQLKQ